MSERTGLEAFLSFLKIFFATTIPRVHRSRFSLRLRCAAFTYHSVVSRYGFSCRLSLVLMDGMWSDVFKINSLWLQTQDTQK